MENQNKIIIWNRNKKGKSYEEIYGIEKAKQIKEEKRKIMLGKKNPFYGKTHNLEMRKLIGLKGKGRVPWNKDKINIYSELTRKSMCPKHVKNLKGKSYEELYGYEKALEIKNKLSNKIKEMYDNGTANFGFPTDGTMKIKRQLQIFPLKDTKIEVKIQNFVKQLGLEFFTHQYIDIKYGYQSDILIPVQSGITQKIVIEVDGDWWHGNTKVYDFRKLPMHIKEQIPLDFERTMQLEEAGFKVLRLWENEIKKMSLDEFKEKLYNIKETSLELNNKITMKGGK